MQFKKSLFFVCVLILSSCVKQKNWPEILEQNHSNLRPLRGGLTNDSFVLTYKDKKYVVKHLARNSQALGIDRRLELNFQNAAAVRGLSPKIHYIDDLRGLYVADFLEGRPLCSEDLNQKEMLETLVGFIKKLHERTRQGYYKVGINPLKRSHGFMKQLQGGHSPYLNSLKPLYEIVLNIEKKLPYATVQVASHNDLFSSNIILNKENVSAIDWEYAGWASPYVDLTLMIVEDGIPIELHDVILKKYFGHLHEAHRDLFQKILFLTRFSTACWYAQQLLNNKQKALHHEYKRRFKAHIEKLKSTKFTKHS